MHATRRRVSYDRGTSLVRGPSHMPILVERLGCVAMIAIAAGAAAAGEQAPATVEPTAAASPSQPAEEQSATFASLAGRVLDRDGLPVAGAHVWLRHGAVGRERFEQAASDQAGRYRFAQVEPGGAVLWVVAPGCAFAGLSCYAAAGQVEKHLNLVVARPARAQSRSRIKTTNRSPGPSSAGSVGLRASRTRSGFRSRSSSEKGWKPRAATRPDC